MQNLIFFNEKGYPINFKYENFWEGELILPKCSSDLWKILHLHIFEKIPGWNITDNSDLVNIEWFNSFRMNFVPNITIEKPINYITTLNNSSDYNSKIISGPGIERAFPVGTWIYFENVLDNLSSPVTEFNSIGPVKKSFYVLSSRQDQIIINTQNNNSIALPTFDLTTAKIKGLNAVQMDSDNLSGWTDWNQLNDWYVDKRFNVIGTDYNDGILNTSDPYFELKYRNEKLIGFNDINYIPIGNTLTLKISNLDITEPIDTNNDDIIDSELPITYNESIIIDSNGALVALNKILKKLNIPDLFFVLNYTGFYIISNIPDKRFKVELSYTNGINTTNINVINRTRSIYVLGVSDVLTKEINTNVYKQPNIKIKFNSLGSTFKININSLDYDGINTGTITSSLSDWVSEHSLTLSRLGISVSTNSDEINISTFSVDTILNVIVNPGTGGSHKFLLNKYKFSFIDENIDFTIDGINYTTEFNNTINITLNDFITQYNPVFNEFGLSAEVVYPDTINFYIKDLNQTFSHSVNAGNLGIYYREDYDTRSTGSFITSNELRMSGPILDLYPLYVGSKINVSNSFYTTNNVEYTVLNSLSDRLVLSYTNPFYSDTGAIKLSARESVRYPRDSYSDNIPVSLRFRLEHGRYDLEEKPFSIIDLSGDNLLPKGIYTYTGPKPLYQEPENCITLPELTLNRTDNNKLNFIELPEYQKTQFEEVTFLLPRLDDNTEKTLYPTPININVAFRSLVEGEHDANLIIEKIEDLEIIITTDPNALQPTILDINTNVLTITGPYSNLMTLGFKPGQKFQMIGIDVTNITYKSVFRNNGFIGTITKVSANQIWFESEEDNSIIPESSLRNFVLPISPFNIVSTGIEITIKLLPMQIGSIKLLAETVVEDYRYKWLMENKGIKLGTDLLPIFEQTELDNSGVDWNFMNTKRKELLLVFREIYNYIGTYKALINSILFFEWDKLHVTEYWRNEDEESEFYGILFPIKLKRIFDKKYEGWDTDNSLTNLGIQNKYKKTNILGLTFPWTDEEGNFSLIFSLKDTFEKLYALKNWLTNNIIPLSIKLKEIRADAYLPSKTVMYHETHSISNKTDIQTILKMPDVKTKAQLIGVNTEKDNLLIGADCPAVDELRMATSNWNVCLEFLGELEDKSTFSLDVRTYSYDKENDNYILVQDFSEYKKDLSAYWFSLDLVIDPYIEIQMRIYNGYGTALLRTRTFKIIP